MLASVNRAPPNSDNQREAIPAAPRKSSTSPTTPNIAKPMQSGHDARSTVRFRQQTSETSMQETMMGRPPLKGSAPIRTPKKSASAKELMEPSNVPKDIRQQASPTTVKHRCMALMCPMTCLIDDGICSSALQSNSLRAALCQFFQTQRICFQIVLKNRIQIMSFSWEDKSNNQTWSTAFAFDSGNGAMSHRKISTNHGGWSGERSGIHSQLCRVGHARLPLCPKHKQASGSTERMHHGKDSTQ